MPPFRIIVFEDDSVLRSLLIETLELEGYATAEATSFDQALHLAGEEQGQVLVADFWGTSHESLSEDEREQIGALQARARVLLVTGRAWARTATAEQLGVAGIVQKPFDLDRFLAVLEAMRAEP